MFYRCDTNRNGHNKNKIATSRYFFCCGKLSQEFSKISLCVCVCKRNEISGEKTVNANESTCIWIDKLLLSIGWLVQKRSVADLVTLIWLYAQNRSMWHTMNDRKPYTLAQTPIFIFLIMNAGLYVCVTAEVTNLSCDFRSFFFLFISTRVC